MSLVKTASRRQAVYAAVAIFMMGLFFVAQPGSMIAPSPILAETVPAATPLPAFPGAEGFGAYTIGGRGGAVIEVTNLYDAGSGSLRNCVEASGPRICVFRIGGTVELNESLVIENPYITIAGQTAPGDGITLRNSATNADTPLKIKAHDVVVRYIRSRPGSNPADTGTLDALTIGNKARGKLYNVIIDHSSFSWATDEVLNIYYDAHDVTVQWSIIAEGLEWSTHFEGGQQQPHSMGMLLGENGSKDFSIHHNLFAHNRHRNPKVKTSGLVDLVNNVMYNTGSGAGWRAPSYVVQREPGVTTLANFVGNYFKPGSDTGQPPYFIETKDQVAVYIEGNHVPAGVESVNPESQQYVVAERFVAPEIVTTSANVAYAQVLAEVGASKRLTCDGTFVLRRDPVDQRVVADVLAGSGEIIDHPSQVGGWPKLAAGTPCLDTDHDGMPDEWEILHGFDPTDPTDSVADADLDQYTNIEEYLNGTGPRGMATPRPTRTPGSTIPSQISAEVYLPLVSLKLIYSRLVGERILRRSKHCWQISK